MWRARNSQASGVDDWPDFYFVSDKGSVRSNQTGATPNLGLRLFYTEISLIDTK